jgi:hypothetical protein
MNFRISTISALSALLVLPSFAIEAPSDDAPPPADIARENEPEARNKAAHGEASAYLGVVAEKVPDLLASHLDLEVGQGIVLLALMDGSPAAVAGLKVHDVITRVAGLAVASSDELTATIGSHKPGDVVQLEIIRKGKPLKSEVTLGSRPLDLAGQLARPLDQLNLDGIPDHFADRVRKMIEGNLDERLFEFGEGIHDLAPEIDRAMQDMRDKVRGAMGGMQELKIPGGDIRINQGATFRMMDDEGSIELKKVDEGKEVTVRDPQGNITWTGPWDTDQDKAGAPEEVRRRVERLNFQDHPNGIQLHLRNGGVFPDGP